MMQWEQIDNCIQRTPIFGGWLVREYSEASRYFPEGYRDGYSFRREDGYEWRPALTFVPDPNHEWDLSRDYTSHKGVFRGL